jgi:hypothetical protein
MKQSQWVVAASLLAGMVFLITFAMNYLGNKPVSQALATASSEREVRFFWKSVPGGTHSGLELEEKEPGHQDFWFRNENKEPVKVGFKSKSCKCTAVELFLLPQGDTQGTLADAIARGGPSWNAQGSQSFWDDLVGPMWDDPKAGEVLQALASSAIAGQAVSPTELIRAVESVTVPGGAIGWVRMRWTGERPGPQSLKAVLWMDNPDTGPSATLETRVMFHEPLRVRSILRVGLLTQDQVGGDGVQQEIVCWSSTRSALNLEAKSGESLGKADSDPFLVGKPVRLTPAEMRLLEEANNKDARGPDNTMGRVMCAYRIPFTIKAVSKDGKTPFEVGPFRRHIVLSSPDVHGEAKQVAVTGRVRGPVLIGNEEGGEIDFLNFPRRNGSRTEKISLQSDVPGLALELDRKRTPDFLEVKLQREKEVIAGRQVWTLSARVKPGKATGVFPRREDPRFADSAIYLKMTIPGKADGSVRIATQGTANES